MGIEPDIYDVFWRTECRSGQNWKSHSAFDGKRKYPCSVRIPGQDRNAVRFMKARVWRGLLYEEYGDPEKWKEIARENHITNPLQVKPGQVLRLPAL